MISSVLIELSFMFLIIYNGRSYKEKLMDLISAVLMKPIKKQ